MNSMGIAVNPSPDKTRPLIRLVGLIASMWVFAFLWSGDQKVQAEIAAARAKNRPAYAGPAVLHIAPQSKTVRTIAAQPKTMRFPAGEYQVTDERGLIGRLIVGPQGHTAPVSQQDTIPTMYGALKLKPVQTATTSSFVYR